MMYCSIDDIMQAIDERTIAQLSNDTDPNLVDVDVVNSLILHNSELIDGYLRGRYPLPLLNEHGLLKQTSIDLVKYDLYKRRDKLSDRMQEQRKELMMRLSNIQKGIITLDEGTPNSRPSAIAVTSSKPVFGNILNQYRNL